MKNTLTLLALAAMFPLAAQITNGGFENWTIETLYEDPSDWQTGNWFAPNNVNTTKVGTLAPSGNFAVHLETTLVGTDTIFGFILQGDFDDNGDPGEGIPWNTEIQAIEGFARYEVIAGDTAILVMAAWANGSLIAEELVMFTGSQSAWAPFSSSLNAGAITPDSILVAAASSNAINEIGVSPGSWLELDAIRLTSPNEPNPNTIPNYDFETWADISVEDPDNWATFNGFLVPFGLTSVEKSADANSGSFSALIKTEFFQGDILEGLLTNGEIDQNSPIGGVPYVAAPALFSGAYKYIPFGQDTAIIGVIFYANGSAIGASFINIGQSAPAWTPFNENILIAGQPDTMAVLIFCGQNEGSMLYVDDLDLTGGTVGIQEISATNIVVFPNPATDKVTILSASDLGLSEIFVFDLSGRVVLQQSTVLNTRAGYELDIHELPSGIYILEIGKDGERFRERLVKE